MAIHRRYNQGKDWNRKWFIFAHSGGTIKDLTFSRKLSKSSNQTNVPHRRREVNNCFPQKGKPTRHTPKSIVETAENISAFREKPFSKRRNMSSGGQGQGGGDGGNGPAPAPVEPPTGTTADKSWSDYKAKKSKNPLL
jgi:hypothetical protein